MTQIQLTDPQVVVLSTACARENGLIFPVTAKLKGGAVGNVCKSLLKRGLIEEIPAADPDTVWRHGDAGSLTLRATPLAYSALGLRDADADENVSSPESAPREVRKGTKQATLIAMLQTPDGATIDDITAATGWQAHTVRGAMAGALKKKLGLTIASEKVDGRGRCYRIVSR